MKMYSAVGFKKKGNSEGHWSAFVKYQLYAFSHTWLSLPIELSKSQGACESVSAHMCRKVGSEKTLYQLSNKNGIMGIG